jgi:hypothetical protein
VSLGVAYEAQITQAAQRWGLDPKLLAAVAAQETGGPGSNSGRNVIGDGGHGHGLFQIDDRSHAFARTPDAMDPAKNADEAAHMIHDLLAQNGGNVHAALSAYNAGSPTATGTTTTWPDGATLGYADSVERHYSMLDGSANVAQSEPGDPTGTDQASTDQMLAALADESPLMPLSFPSTTSSMSQSLQQMQQTDSDSASLIDGIFGD